MPIQVLSDVVLPESLIRTGIAGKNVRNNTRSISGSGFASINVNWSRTLRQFELGIKPMGLEQWQEIEALHEVTEGGAFGFLMQDPKDFTCALDDGFLVAEADGVEIGSIGLGFGVPFYRLRKRYTAIGGSRVHYRAITRPQEFIAVQRNGSTVSAAVNYDTGTVSFTADASQAIQAITTGTTTVLTFADELGMIAAMSTGQRVYVSGVTGTAASILNNKSHVVLSKFENTMTIDVNTATLAAGDGTAAKYPQTTDALTWVGKFYVPVHFANDAIDWELLLGGVEDGRIVAGQSVLLQEVRE
jgi:uncharacterized protein (TIGR02217 family)